MLISAPIGVVFDLARAAAGTGVTKADRPHRLLVERASGPWRSTRELQRFAETGAGTLATRELEWVAPRGLLRRAGGAGLLRRRLLASALAADTDLRRAAEAASTVDAVPAEAPAPAPAVVVGAALLDGAGRVLAAQRARPPALAGRWEFPGGKVEAGESEAAALVRECREELGVEVALEARLGADLPVEGGGAVLRVWTGRIVAGTAAATDHAALRWLTAAELDEVDWLPADRPLVDLLRRSL